jgi:hypothetical protein
MSKVVKLTALGEAALGIALLVVPSPVGRLLLGEGLTGVAIPVARVLGIALVGLGAACWPGPASLGLLIYSAAIALYLATIGFLGVARGVLLWPAVVLHLVLTVWIARTSTANTPRASRSSGGARLSRV